MREVQKSKRKLYKEDAEDLLNFLMINNLLPTLQNSLIIRTFARFCAIGSVCKVRIQTDATKCVT